MYRKIPKISPGYIFFKGPFSGAYFWWGLCMEGNLHFKIDWASFILARKFTIFLFYFVFKGNLQVQVPPPRGGGLYLEGRLNGCFFTLRFWGAYIWRALYMEGQLYGICSLSPYGPGAMYYLNFHSVSRYQIRNCDIIILLVKQTEL